ncbi:hypothetical protein BC332_18372 [Capsicum chinense]|nr:hypothetical protein BC332_18372 [Capsicum chinense]
MNLTKIIKEESATKPIGDDTLVDRVEKIVRLYMLHIPQPTEWKPKHFDVDLRTRVDQLVIDLLGSYFADWMDQHGKLVVPVHGVVLRDYALWFLKHRWLLIGNPAIKKYYTVEFVPSTGSVATLSRGLRKIFKILLELQKDLAHALYGHEIESIVKQTLRRLAMPYRQMGNFVIQNHYGRPRRDVEAIRLSYGSAIGDGYMADIPIRPLGTQNAGQTFTQHTAFIDKTNSLFGNTNEIFDVSMSGRNLKSLLGYDRPTSSGFHLDSMSFPASTCQAGETGQGDILPTWVRPPNDTQIDGSSSVVLSSDEDEFITIDAHMAHPPGPKVPVMRAKKKREEILPTKTNKDGDGFRPLDTLRKPKGVEHSILP